MSGTTYYSSSQDELVERVNNIEESMMESDVVLTDRYHYYFIKLNLIYFIFDLFHPTGGLRDCDAYPTMTKYSWSQYKKYGRFSALQFASEAATDDCFIIDSMFYNTTAARPGRASSSRCVPMHRYGFVWWICLNHKMCFVWVDFQKS